MSSGSLIRISIFVALLTLLAIAERFAARRPTVAGRVLRWTSNFGLASLGLIAVQLLAIAIPLSAAYAAAALAEARCFGLWRWLGLPGPANFLLTLLAFDLAIYAQHVAFHKIPVLWRLHRVHHTDLDLDVTSALRFHPAEIALSMLLKSGLALLLGAAPSAILLFEVILNGMAMFNHANLGIPPRADAWLRIFAVTPDMHRVHHSARREETDSNYGFNLPWWDRVFRTYRPQPRRGHRDMTLGLEEFRDPAALHAARLLVLPFERPYASRSSNLETK